MTNLHEYDARACTAWSLHLFIVPALAPAVALAIPEQVLGTSAVNQDAAPAPAHLYNVDVVVFDAGRPGRQAEGLQAEGGQAEAGTGAAVSAAAAVTTVSPTVTVNRAVAGAAPAVSVSTIAMTVPAPLCSQ